MKKTIEQKKSYDFIPVEGKPAPLAPGLHWLRFALPFELNHINLWLIEGAKGYTVVDSGFNYGETIAQWEALLRDIFKAKPVETIFITHFHPDHFGLAKFLADKTGAPVHMTPGERKMSASLLDADSLVDLYTPYYIEAGVDAVLLQKLMDRRQNYKKVISGMPEVTAVNLNTDIFLGDRKWRVLGGGGHSPEHACLYDAENKIFIAGDVVLPGITPNISFFPGYPPEHDPVADYLNTLTRIENEVPDDVTVLPSHGEPFAGLHGRIAAIKAHHEKRLAKIRAICETPQTALEVMRALFSHRELGVSDLFFALGETLAHLIHDEKRGLIGKTAKDGVSHYFAKK